MVYNGIAEGVFLDRPNRFIANVEIDGQPVVCHVKNTGRCKELLISGRRVFLEKSSNPNRRTAYDLVAVDKDGRLINMDSMAPNKAAAEFLPTIFPNSKIKQECTFGNSRFDFLIEGEKGKTYLEVKGVTLEREGVMLFPDAPTERGVKHINELVECTKYGYNAAIFFVIQTKGVKYFTPNEETHREFAEALRNAKNQGVEILAADCFVTRDSMTIRDFVEVRL